MIKHIQFLTQALLPAVAYTDNTLVVLDSEIVLDGATGKTLTLAGNNIKVIADASSSSKPRIIGRLNAPAVIITGNHCDFSPDCEYVMAEANAVLPVRKYAQRNVRPAN